MPALRNADEFYVIKTYSGRGIKNRGFSGYITDNSHMYDCLDAKVSKRAFCIRRNKPVAVWHVKVDGSNTPRSTTDHESGATQAHATHAGISK